MFVLCVVRFICDLLYCFVLFFELCVVGFGACVIYLLCICCVCSV